jgi:hypothetical protein
VEAVEKSDPLGVDILHGESIGAGVDAREEHLGPLIGLPRRLDFGSNGVPAVPGEVPRFARVVPCVLRTPLSDHRITSWIDAMQTTHDFDVGKGFGA